MNLGQVYIEAFLVIATAAILIAVTLSVFLYLFGNQRIRPWCAWTGCVIWLFLTVAGNIQYHKKLFTALHKLQNSVLPNSGCLYYEPTVTTLHAVYKLNANELEDWIKGNPWKLHEAPRSYLLRSDERHFGSFKPDLSFETDMSESGRQLRVYYKNGIVYVSYSSM